MNFFDLLMRSMGQNIKFIIEHVCEGDDFTAGVNWHLGNYQTPFFPILIFFVYDKCNFPNKREFLSGRMETDPGSLYQRMQLL